jgi:hypothetical protein
MTVPDACVRACVRSVEPFHLLSNVPLPEIRARFAVLQGLNATFTSVLPLVNFTQAASPWSLAHRLSSLSHIIFFDVKGRVFNRILSQVRPASPSGAQGTHARRPRPRRPTRVDARTSPSTGRAR